MTARSIDWPWTLTKLCLALLLAHFLFIIGAGLLLPADSSLALRSNSLIPKTSRRSEVPGEADRRNASDVARRNHRVAQSG